MSFGLKISFGRLCKRQLNSWNYEHSTNREDSWICTKHLSNDTWDYYEYTDLSKPEYYTPFSAFPNVRMSNKHIAWVRKGYDEAEMGEYEKKMTILPVQRP